MADSFQKFIVELVDTLFSKDNTAINLKEGLIKTANYFKSECGWIKLWEKGRGSRILVEYNLPQELNNLERDFHNECQTHSLLFTQQESEVFFVDSCELLKCNCLNINSITCHLTVPIRANKNFLGSFNLGFVVQPAISKEKLALIAKAFGVAIANYVYLKKIEEKKKQLEQKSKDLETLVTAISHDMKNPIITAKGFLSLINRKYSKKMKKEMADYLGHIEKGILRIEELVKDLINLRQTEKLLKAKEQINIKEAIKSALRYIKPLIRHRMPKIKIEGESPKLWGNSLAFFQIFTNLIANAIKYTPDDRTPLVLVGFGENKKFYVISVKDNGIGFTKKEIKEAFNPFSKLKTLDREGSGVGLSIVKRIVEGFGGKIEVESEKNVGSTFMIYWPKKIISAEGETRTRTGLTPLDPEPSVSASSTTSA